MSQIGRTGRSEQHAEIDGPGGDGGEAPGLSRRRFAQLLGAGVAAAGGAGLAAAVPARAAGLRGWGRAAAGAPLRGVPSAGAAKGVAGVVRLSSNENPTDRRRPHSTPCTRRSAWLGATPTSTSTPSPRRWRACTASMPAGAARRRLERDLEPRRDGLHRPGPPPPPARHHRHRRADAGIPGRLRASYRRLA